MTASRQALASAASLFAALTVVIAASGAAGASAPAPEATLTPLAANEIRLRVVNDLNADGAAQPDEPGIAGLRILGGCSDALSLYTTDGDGYATGSIYAAHECFRVTRDFGWLPTTPLALPIPAGVLEHTFLLHDLRPSVMEVRGATIVNGMPGGNLEFSREAPPFTGNGEGCVERSDDRGDAVVFIIGERARPGCPTDGATFGLLLGGAPVGTFTFREGTNAATTFVVGPDSMRFYAADISSADVIDRAGRVTGRDCAVIQPLSGFVPPGSVYVIVMPDELLPGCGAPGRMVRLLRDGAELVPFEWAPGDAGPAFEVKPRVVLPNTGDGSSGLPALPRIATFVLILGATCFAAMFVASVARARRS